jgi:hypothetical protein
MLSTRSLGRSFASLIAIGLATVSTPVVPAAAQVPPGQSPNCVIVGFPCPAPDLTQLAVGADAIGDGWVGGGGMQTPKDAATFFEPPNPSASYSADYTNGPAHPGLDHLSVLLAAYPDRQTALNSSGFTDRQFYWGHGNTTFTDLTGQYGDGPAYRALGIQDGITFLDGTIVAYVSVLSANMPLDDENALVAQVASAEDALLQANATPAASDQSSPSTTSASTTSLPASAPVVNQLQAFKASILVPAAGS